MIKTSANVQMSGGKTGNQDRAGQSGVPSKARKIDTSVTVKGRSYDSFYGGMPRRSSAVKTTGGVKK